MFDFLKIKQTIASLGNELEKLRAEREQLLRKREDLEATLINTADLVELIDAWIDRQAADFPKRLESGVDYYRRHALVSLPENPKTAAHPIALLTATADPNAAATIGTLEKSLFYVLNGPIKAGLRLAVESMDFSDSGPPRVERVAEIAKIDKRIDELDRQEAELVEQAEKAGLRL